MTMNVPVFDIHAVLKRLPHRYPFLMVDRIVEVGPDFAVGLKNVTVNESCFQGHFPGHPVMPGALITEALLQTSAFIGAQPSGTSEPRKQFLCAGFAMKFAQLVTPGDQLRLEVRLMRSLAEMTKASAIARIIGGGVAASGDLTLVALSQTESGK
ncbi:3-hydroxyacyl-ACP dehydratase FabZ [Verminephrobacter aporrectodeae]|uniref:3-hydroxyacyl-ACP dehydratase FabZ n=2 Tax=Verminephrobacter aporrectodeae TaxID=1110389 RepID=UPI0005952D0F|nr:3-hydroxyacyl-ACP dehydratase FabZ [Verminephrobacter aporrectodeae]